MKLSARYEHLHNSNVRIYYMYMQLFNDFYVLIYIAAYRCFKHCFVGLSAWRLQIKESEIVVGCEIFTTKLFIKFQGNNLLTQSQIHKSFSIDFREIWHRVTFY